MIKHYEISINGQVQDVGFRYTTQQMAHSLGINGTVQNLSDGVVYIQAEGEEANLDKFLQWCQEGPDAARVNKVDYKIGEPKNFHDFEIIT